MPSNVIIYTVGFSTSSSPIDAQGLNLLNLRRPKQKMSAPRFCSLSGGPGGTQRRCLRISRLRPRYFEPA